MALEYGDEYTYESVSHDLLVAVWAALPVSHKPTMTNEIAYMVQRNILSCMNRRYDETIASLVEAMAKAYSTWET